jgi:acyl carrier protein
MTTSESIRKLIATVLDCGVDLVSPAKTFDELGADSLDMQELFLQVEYNFDVDVSNEDGARIKTVGELIKFVKQEKGEP